MVQLARVKMIRRFDRHRACDRQTDKLMDRQRYNSVSVYTISHQLLPCKANVCRKLPLPSQTIAPLPQKSPLQASALVPNRTKCNRNRNPDPKR